MARKELRVIGSLVSLMLLVGCIGGIGNKEISTTTNSSVNVIVAGDQPVKVLDQAGNWVDVGSADPYLLAARGIVYTNGRYSYLGPQENVQYAR